MFAKSLSLCLLLSASWCLASDWHQFRGPDATGTVKNSGIADSWPESGPRELWRKPIGAGYAELALADGIIYTATSAKEGDTGREFVAAYKAENGEEIWRSDIDELLSTEFGDGGRSTPTIDGDMLYTVSARGRLVGVMRKDGKIVWDASYADYDSDRPTWGFAGSTVVEGDLLIATVGGKEHGMYVAFDKKTGEQRWESLSGRSGYSTPTRLNLFGKRLLFGNAGQDVVAIDTNGKEQWRMKFGRYIPIAMPLFVAPDKFLFSSNDEKLSIMVRLREENGKITHEELWRSTRYTMHFSSGIYRDGHIYGFDTATFKCIEANTGEMVWGKRGLGKGSAIMADDKLLILSDRGTLVMARATTEGYQELGRHNVLQGKSWTAPSLVEGILYLRNHTEMVAYDLK